MAKKKGQEEVEEAQASLESAMGTLEESMKEDPADAEKVDENFGKMIKETGRLSKALQKRVKEELPSTPEELFAVRKETEAEIASRKEQLTDLEAEIAVFENHLFHVNAALAASLGLSSGSVSKPRKSSKPEGEGKRTRTVITPDDKAKIRGGILSALEKGGSDGLSVKDILSATGYTKPVLMIVLKTLLKDGEVILKGEKRNARYHAA